jgi:DNA-binding MarR family transcriptional regulator
MLWESISFINRSKNRKIILFKLVRPTTPTVLSKELGLHRSVVSRSLLALEKQGLATCLNPESKKERYYRITKKGEEIKRKIERM